MTMFFRHLTEECKGHGAFWALVQSSVCHLSSELLAPSGLRILQQTHLTSCQTCAFALTIQVFPPFFLQWPNHNHLLRPSSVCWYLYTIWTRFKAARARILELVVQFSHFCKEQQKGLLLSYKWQTHPIQLHTHLQSTFKLKAIRPNVKHENSYSAKRIQYRVLFLFQMIWQ